MPNFCPHQEPFEFNGESFTAEEILHILTPLMREERRDRLIEVVARRTYSVVPVMECLYDRGNVSAVIRSAEALGYQAVHVIDTSLKFKEANRVTQGADKWLDITTWESTPSCIDTLKAQGYRIAATHLDADAVPIGEVDFTIPTALVFGNERDGVSEELLERADLRVILPMTGFTQSFNISVAAALCLYHIQRDRRQRLGHEGDLDPTTQQILLAEYYLRSVDNAEKVLLKSRKI